MTFIPKKRTKESMTISQKLDIINDKEKNSHLNVCIQETPMDKIIKLNIINKKFNC